MTGGLVDDVVDEDAEGRGAGARFGRSFLGGGARRAALSESRAANEGGFSEIGGVPALSSSKEAVELFVWRVMDDVEVGGER